MIKEAKDLKQDYKEKRDEITQLKKELAQVMVYKNSWRWMKNVKNVDDLKEKNKNMRFLGGCMGYIYARNGVEHKINNFV